MRLLILTTAAIGLFASAALAQNVPAQPATPAVKTTDGNNAVAPAAAITSLSRSQALDKIEGLGYIDVTSLKKDQSGVWHGLAMKNGQPIPVSVDTQGNVDN